MNILKISCETQQEGRLGPNPVHVQKNIFIFIFYWTSIIKTWQHYFFLCKFVMDMEESN